MSDLAAKANTADLKPVAISGSYTDLSKKPAIPDGSVYAASNGAEAGIIDHSEAEISSVIAESNTGNGIWIRNVHSCNLWGLAAKRNGGAGIFAWGMVYSQGGAWFSAGNGDGVATQGEIVFAATTVGGGYGITRKIKVSGIQTGTDFADFGTPTSPKAQYGVWFKAA